MVRECRLFGSWSLVCSSVYSCIAHPLLVCRSSASSCIARASARPSARPPARASLACRSFAAALLESWAFVRLIIRYSSVCSCIVHLLLTCPLVHICSCIGCASLVCLFLCRSSVCSSLPRRWSAVDLPLICHACIARLSPRLSAGLPLSCRWCIAALSARVVAADLSAALPLVLPLLCLFVRRWSLTGPSLVCLFVSLCSVTYPSLSRLLGPWSLTCLLVSYLSLLCRWSVARLLHSAVPLLDSAAPLLHCSTRLALHSYSVG